MIKKIFYVFVVALITQTIAGCVDCNCSPIKKIYFTIKNFSLVNLDSALPEPMVTNAGIIASTKYGVRINLLTEQVAARKQHIKFGLMQTALACSCPEDEYISKENILSVQIFSNNDFDASHPKNTDLSLYFKVKTYNSAILITDYLKLLKENNHKYGAAFFDGVFLQVAPTSNKKHKFRVKFTLSDGRILEAEAAEVELT